MKTSRQTIYLTLVFIFIAVVFIVMEARPNFPDPDSFYHAKMALTIREQGFIETFPWLKETILNESFVNHHLLYHLILIPFVTFFDPMIGIKIAATIFALLAFLAIYKFLRYLKTPYPEWLTLAAVFSTSFVFRMALPRAPALSLIFLLIGLWAMMEKRLWLIFFGAAAFVWLYNGWPLLLVGLAALIFGRVLGELAFSEQSIFKSLAKALSRESKVVLVLLSGLTWGLIIHPYFPANLNFAWLHIIKIGFFNATNNIPVGQEWYPASPWDFYSFNFPALAAVVLGLCLASLALMLKKENLNKKNFEQLFTLIVLAGAMTVMTLKSARYFEYSIPFVILAAGTLFSLSRPLLKTEIEPLLREKISRWPQKIITLLLGLIIIIGFTAGNYWNTRPGDDYYQAQQYQGAANWIKNNLPGGETVFHNLWDFSVILWYLDDRHNYLVGLDPVFMADKSPERFAEWQALASGEDAAVEKIIIDFNSRVVVIDERDGNHDRLMNNLRASRLFTEVYYNEWLHVFAAPELVL